MKKNLIVSIALAGLFAASSASAQATKAPSKTNPTQSSTGQKKTVTKTTSTQTPKSKVPMLKTKADQFSYAIGLNIAQGIKQQGLGDSINVDALSQAISDVLKNKKPLIKAEESQSIIQAYFADQQAKVGGKSTEEGKKFLEENKKKSGVKVTASGLQYQVIKEGTGVIPKDTNQVTVHYHGTLISGEVFDSSVDRGEPATFPVNGVIKGWVEGLQLMKVGSKYKFFIPSDLAYGNSGAGPKIGPNTTLIFDVELISIAK